MNKQDLPLHHVLAGRAFVVVAEFADSEEGARQANTYMEEHAGIGVLEVTGGRVILASNEDKGVEVGRERGMICTCCGGYTRGRQWHNQDTGYGLCMSCIDYCGRHYTSAYEYQSVYGLRGAHYDLGGAQ